MKKIFLIISFVVCNYLFGFAQCNTTGYTLTNIKTPNGSTVPDTYILTSSDFATPNQGQIDGWIEELQRDYAATYMGPPSLAYNCHGYAWHVSEGGNKVWIGFCTTSAHSIYWTDGSYTAVSESQATKVAYDIENIGKMNSGNHSAIRINSSTYQSKWGYWYLVKHNPNCVPSGYKADLTKGYYKRATPPNITGPTRFCLSSSGTYNITDAPAGFEWGKSSSSIQITPSGSSYKVTATSAGAGWISINHAGNELKRFNFTVEEDLTTSNVSLSYNTNSGPGSYVHIIATVPATATNVTYQWDPDEWIELPTPPTLVTVTCKVTSTCNSTPISKSIKVRACLGCPIYVP